MKEFPLSLKAAFSNGLRPDDRMPRNSDVLTECQNVRITGVGDTLTPSTYTPITYPSGIQSVTIDFPFPQLFKGSQRTILADKTALYSITETGNWTKAAITTNNAYSVEAARAITSGSSWHFADFGYRTYALFNGSCTVFRTSRLSMFVGGAQDELFVEDSVTINSGCNCRGRMVLGGFNSDNFFNSGWQSINSTLFGSIVTALGITAPVNPGSNWVWWSPIGTGAFLLFYPSDYTTGLVSDAYPDVDHSMLFELVKRGDMGFMPMNWQGTVRCVKTLGKGVMVYGDNGISYMPMHEHTFGLLDLLPYGVESRSSVGGNETEHVFVDEAGWLWRVRSGEAPRKLGFREFFENMIGNDIVVSHNPIEEEYYISDGSLCYVLTKDDKLYETTFLVTSIAVSGGGAVGVYDRPGDADDNYAVMATDVIDMGMRSLKTIERVVVSTTNTTTVSVAVDWRNKTSDSWSRTSYYNTNYEGVAYLPVMGLEFRVVVRCTDYTKMDVDNVVIHFKVDDRRIVRGVYALENVARSNI